MPAPLKLDPAALIEKEFDYIAQTAFQANEDRARLVSLYLVTAASLLGAILGAGLVPPAAWVYRAFAGLFLLLTIFGVLSLLELVRLRQAWLDSARAMNAIKEHYIRCYPELAQVFLWRMKTLPRGDKPWSIGFLHALQISLLGAVTSAAAAFCLSLALGKPSWLTALLTGIGVLIGQVWLYLGLLHERRARVRR